MSTILRPARFVALDWMLQQAADGQHESAGRNRSPLIDRINRFAGVPLGSPYCAAAAHYAFHVAGVDDFGGPSCASVGFVDQWAHEKKYVVQRPLKGDGFCWRLDGDDWPDHFGMVVRVLEVTSVRFECVTVEANTSSGNSGSQSEGGGFYVRTREFTEGDIDLIRDPRRAKLDPFARQHETAAQAEKRLAALRVWIVARHREGWTWPQIKKTANWREYKRRGGK